MAIHFYNDATEVYETLDVPTECEHYISINFKGPFRQIERGLYEMIERESKASPDFFTKVFLEGRKVHHWRPGVKLAPTGYDIFVIEPKDAKALGREMTAWMKRREKVIRRMDRAWLRSRPRTTRAQRDGGDVK